MVLTMEVVRFCRGGVRCVRGWFCRCRVREINAGVVMSGLANVGAGWVFACWKSLENSGWTRADTVCGVVCAVARW
jgi:hypothetical protein